MMREGEQIFDVLRLRLEEQVGPSQMRTFENTLRVLVPEAPARPDAPGWVADTG